MLEFESRKLWGLVSQGIREGDYETAAREKSKIEVREHSSCSRSVVHLAFQNDQRQRRRDEVAAETTWPLKHFSKLGSDPVCAPSVLLLPQPFLNSLGRSQTSGSPGIPISLRKRKTVMFTRTTLPRALPKTFHSGRDGAKVFGRMLLDTPLIATRTR